MAKLYFIGAGPGDPELITLKGQRLISEADVIIYAGSLVNPEILKYGKAGAEIYNSATMNLDEVLEVEIEALKAGKMWPVFTPGIPPFTVQSRNRWTVSALLAFRMKTLQWYRG